MKTPPAVILNLDKWISIAWRMNPLICQEHTLAILINQIDKAIQRVAPSSNPQHLTLYPLLQNYVLLPSTLIHFWDAASSYGGWAKKDKQKS